MTSGWIMIGHNSRVDDGPDVNLHSPSRETCRYLTWPVLCPSKMCHFRETADSNKALPFIYSARTCLNNLFFAFVSAHGPEGSILKKDEEKSFCLESFVSPSESCCCERSCLGLLSSKVPQEWDHRVKFLRRSQGLHKNRPFKIPVFEFQKFRKKPVKPVFEFLQEKRIK